MRRDTPHHITCKGWKGSSLPGSWLGRLGRPRRRLNQREWKGAIASRHERFRQVQKATNKLKPRKSLGGSQVVLTTGTFTPASLWHVSQNLSWRIPGVSLQSSKSTETSRISKEITSAPVWWQVDRASISYLRPGLKLTVVAGSPNIGEYSKEAPGFTVLPPGPTMVTRPFHKQLSSRPGSAYRDHHLWAVFKS